MSKITCATQKLAKPGVSFTLHRYAYDPGGQRGLQIEIDPNELPTALDAIVAALT